MTEEHPITPPLKLVREWQDIWTLATIKDVGIFEFVATQAARWGADQQLQLDAEQINQAWQKGADQELEACCEWLEDADLDDSQKVSWVNLRVARRPKPPSLKEQALALISHDPENQPFLSEKGIAIIRQALESLPD